MSEDIFKSAVDYHSKKNFSKAKELYEDLLKTNSENIAILQNYASLLSQIKEYKKAEDIFKKCLKIKPNDSLVLYNFGKFFQEQKIFNRAIELYNKSIKIDPKNSVSLYNLGNIYSSLKEFGKSIEYFKKATDINPKNYYAYNNLGFSYKYKGNFNLAQKYYKKAIETNPNFVEAHVNYSTILLSLKKFDDGFKEYEWRKKSKLFSDYLNYKNLKIKSPIWRGENLDNKKILIFSEQGIGDLFQFSRYLYELKEEFRCGVIFRIKHNLSHMFEKNGQIKILTEKEKIPEHHFHNHLMSLPGIYYKKNKSFPKNKNFINLDKKNLDKWTKYFSSFKGLKVGINAGSTVIGQLQRMIPLNEFRILTELKHINFFIIQKDFNKEKMKYLNNNSNVHLFEKLDEECKPFEDTVSIIKNLDLIITADTSVAHVSATLKKKTWVALPLICDWRWFHDDKKSVWYNNVKLFRQKKNGNWNDIFQKIKQDIKNNF